jgi:hypothetical protein
VSVVVFSATLALGSITMCAGVLGALDDQRSRSRSIQSELAAADLGLTARVLDDVGRRRVVAPATEDDELV